MVRTVQFNINVFFFTTIKNQQRWDKNVRSRVRHMRQHEQGPLGCT